MPSFGGRAPFPLRFGGGKPALERHLESVAAQLGTAYDTTDTNGLVWVRVQAIARVVWGLWESNTRLRYQWDPSRMTDFLGRWEKILALAVSPDDSLSTRRARVGVKIALAGYANGRAVHDTCAAYLGSTFVGIATYPSSTAQVWTPSGWPMGNHPVFATDPDWYSSVAHFDVLTSQPASMGDSEYIATRATIIPALDEILPAWVTFDVIKDGASGNLFKLDDAGNLGNERFGS